mgnify:CR=1 FL=1|jgi:hypothetical protein
MGTFTVGINQQIALQYHLPAHQIVCIFSVLLPHTMHMRRIPFFPGLHLFGFSLICFSSCASKIYRPNNTPFSNTPQQVFMRPLTITEASGIADSRKYPGHLWVQQDSGNQPYLYLMKHDGTVVKSIYIARCWNLDWEDMALSAGPDSGKSYIYIGDIGDNYKSRSEYYIYRLEEPAIQSDVDTNVNRIAFRFPDGNHNSEALLVDPVTHDIYIITKTDHQSKVYKLSYPYSTIDMNWLHEVAVLPYNYVVSAAISDKGDEILVKTYDSILYYTRNPEETIAQAMQKAPLRLPYLPEPQGEAITFAADNSGFFTLSEKALTTRVRLYFYKRK